MHLKSFLKNYFWLILIILAVAVHFAVSLKLALFWYDNFNIGKFDLGNAVQVIYNTLHGKFFVYTDRFGTQISRLSNHADFILLLFVPVFAIFNDPVVLVVAQCLALSFGGLVVYLLARELNLEKLPAALLAGAYLFNIDVGYLALDAFHGITFAIPFVLLSFLFLERLKNRVASFSSRQEEAAQGAAATSVVAKFTLPSEEAEQAPQLRRKERGLPSTLLRTGKSATGGEGNPDRSGSEFLQSLALRNSPPLLGFILATFLVLISKESAALLVAGIGLYAVFAKKLRKIGWITFAVGALWFVGYFFVVSPLYGPARVASARHYLQEVPGAKNLEDTLRQNAFLVRYSHLGDGLFELLLAPFRKPKVFFSAVLNWEYLRRIFLPWGFLPFLAPLALVPALPEYLINTLSAGAFMTHRHYGVLHYISFLIPVAAYAAVLGSKRLWKFCSCTPSYPACPERSRREQGRRMACLRREAGRGLALAGATAKRGPAATKRVTNLCEKFVLYLPFLLVFASSAGWSWYKENPVLVNPVTIARYRLLPKAIQWAEERELKELAVWLSSGQGSGGQQTAISVAPASQDATGKNKTKPDTAEDQRAKEQEQKAKLREKKPRKDTNVYILNPRHSGGNQRVYEYLRGREGAISGPNSLGAKLSTREDYDLFPLDWRSADYVVADLSGPPKSFSSLEVGWKDSDYSGVSAFLRDLLWEMETNSEFGLAFSGDGLAVFERGADEALYEEVSLEGTEEYGWLSHGLIIRNFSVPGKVQAGEEFYFELGWDFDPSVDEEARKETWEAIPFISLVYEGSQSSRAYDAVYGIFLPVGKDVDSMRAKQRFFVPADLEPGVYEVCMGWYELIHTEMSGKVKLQDAVELKRIKIE